MMGFQHSHIAAAPVADVDRFVLSTHMVNGTYGAPANSGTMPTVGARHVTLTRTFDGDADTPGTVTVTGTDMAGQVISETLTPSAVDATLVTGTKWFRTVTAVSGAAWAIDGGGVPANDTITVGCDASHVVAVGAGVLKSIVINTTAAGAVTIADATGTIAVLPANATVGHYVYDCTWNGYLSVLPAAASDLTIVHSGSLPSSYAMS
jgi:hypothetical protein